MSGCISLCLQSHIQLDEELHGKIVLDMIYQPKPLAEILPV